MLLACRSSVISSQRAERAARILRFEVESRSSGAARLQPEGRAMNKNITVVLLLVLAAGCSSKPQDGAYAPPMDTTRKVSEQRSEEHTSELQSQFHLVCRLLLEKKNKNNTNQKK